MACAALEGPLAADPAALPLGQAAPDPELLAVGERVLEALDPDLAAPAHRLGLPGRRAPLREEQVGVDPEAVRPLLPAALVAPGEPMGGDQGGRLEAQGSETRACVDFGTRRWRPRSGAPPRRRNDADWNYNGVTMLGCGPERKGFLARVGFFPALACPIPGAAGRAGPWTLQRLGP